MSPRNKSTPARSFLESFSRLTEENPSATALIDGTTAGLTARRDLLDRGRELAEWLRDSGVRPGDLVAVQLPNSVDFVASFLAILERGATMVPIDRDARESEVASILAAFGVRALVYRSQAGERYPALSIRDVDQAAGAGTPAVPLIKVTSGSTGQPRGIFTSEANLIADCRNICATMDIRPEDRNLGAIPFSHSYGFSNLVTPLLLQGTAIVVSNDYLPLSILNLANNFHCTVVPAIPMVFDHLAQLHRSDGMFVSVRTFLSAGAPLHPPVSRRFRERFHQPIHSFYGCSECGGIAYDREGGSVERGTVGLPMEGVELTVDPQQGRLVVRSGAAATPDGVFIADDIARFTDHGEVELLGRVGDLINIAGKKVNPREVELILLQVPGVREVKVYGEPAGARGEVVAAVVVADPDVTREQVRAFCRERLSSHKVPRIVKFIESIPLDERGKVKRSALALL
jgi:acyl-CoA synthetase (AMP-forming)/AMP-acid ligase II